MTHIILYLLAAALLPMALVLLLPRNREFFQKSAVRGFGLGVYASLVILLLKEAFEHSGVLVGSLWAIGGLIISILIGVYFKEFHHHHESAEGKHHHSKASTWRILLSDFLHNIVDGIAIISGFGFSIGVGLTSLAGIIGHQMVQQGGQQVLLVDSGIKPKRALLISFFVSLSVLLALFLKNGEALESIFIALSAGIISWKVGTDIRHTKWTQNTIWGFVAGAILLSAILILIPHEH